MCDAGSGPRRQTDGINLYCGTVLPVPVGPGSSEVSLLRKLFGTDFGSKQQLSSSREGTCITLQPVHVGEVKARRMLEAIHETAHYARTESVVIPR